VLAKTVIDGRDLSDSWIVGEIAGGKAIKGFIPWDVDIPVDEDKATHQALTSILGSGWETKISLATGFHGWKGDANLRIVPDYGHYTKTMAARTKAMAADKSKSDEWRERIKKKHVVEPWSKFLAQLEAQTAPDNDGISLYVPNFSPSTFDAMLIVSAFVLERVVRDSFKEGAKFPKWTFPKFVI
jgi:hypothetical protein